MLQLVELDVELGVAVVAGVRDLDRIDELGAGNTAAVIMEPNAGTNGIVPPDSWRPALRRATRERGCWLIADEVMSGFGRCGQWFAWQKHGAEHAPDLITCAKGLTGAALPLGAVIVSAAVGRLGSAGQVRQP